jgi:putative peptide zinc metalloprotease protein
MRLAQEEAASAEAEYASVLEELSRLTPLAPFNGQLRDVAPDLERGQFVPGKERLGVVVGDGGMLVETYLDEDEVKRVRVGHEGIFTTDGVEGPVLKLRLAQVDADATRVLPNGLLTAAAGGHILTRSQKSQHVPERSVYRVVLEVVSEPQVLAGQAWRGHVVIRGDAEPLALPFLRKLVAVFIREAGL